MKNLVGAEALVRWIHPELGFQPPDKFIPLFEKNGFITKHWINMYGIKHALSIKEWDDRGFTPISVSVNAIKSGYL